MPIATPTELTISNLRVGFHLKTAYLNAQFILSLAPYASAHNPNQLILLCILSHFQTEQQNKPKKHIFFSRQNILTVFPP